MIIIAILLCGGITPSTKAGIHYVNTNQNIQAVIDIAQQGDTVLLTPSTHYISQQLVITNSIMLLGCSDGSVIHAQNSTRCIYLNHTNAVIYGLTITQGYITEGFGAGIHCEAGLIQNCTITSNTLEYAGDEFSGGGVYLSGAGIISNCVITANSADYGGGIYCDAQSIVTDSKIEGNTANDYGGGVYCRSTVKRCEISDNEASSGSGVYLSSGLLDSCTIHGNTSERYGAGVCANAKVWNSTIYDNHAGKAGGGIYSTSPRTDIRHCTITDNSAVQEGGGIYIKYKQEDIANSIVYSNSSPASPNVRLPVPGSPFSYCISDPAQPGTGNFSSDPLFINPANDNYRLQPNSPCVDSCPADTELSYDLEKNLRPIDGMGSGNPLSDMGAYELSNTNITSTYQVGISASPVEYGNAWPLQYGTHDIATGKIVIASVPAINETGNSRSICMGWTGSGSIPASGLTNDVTFIVNQPSTLEWIWQLQHLISVDSPLALVSGATNGYANDALELTVDCIPTNGFSFHHWEIDGLYAGKERPLYRTLSSPLDIRAVCEPIDTQTCMVDFDPSPWPGIGRNIDYWTEGGIYFTNSAGMGLYNREDSLRPDNGTAYLSPGQRYEPWTCIYPNCEGLIGISSLDAAEYSTVYHESTVSMIGHKPDGTTLTNTFQLDGVIDGFGGVEDFEHFSFPSNFTGFTVIELPHSGYSLDNIAFTIETPDSDNDQMNDAWEIAFFGTATNDANSNADGDQHLDWEEWLTGSNPVNSDDIFTIQINHEASGETKVEWNSISNRMYTIWSKLSLTNEWLPLLTMPGTGSNMSHISEISTNRFFKVEVSE
ncbi:right-handed parallel beta-helix repeat-containing protein [Pontiellaceae bacterium B12227]|nr:right-handed parallel beta-helix repeat-containing protein [Pontiellaceae bacterium B12227]